ncbi:hypothetical protein G7062_02230 [Erysipelothrix sp. HDW6C]|uniref:hypothetical protein n=1 Tax=Erysipelothrix sp. HDW6C TaxID=2714930 RepID=UPI00140E516A|nr:hypothetical protein [Erysipelothrix sp. HDW6C]QIK69174.1 hypothetical protein G7062_02230 [Erysipelothrix sp. HDW6C]
MTQKSKKSYIIIAAVMITLSMVLLFLQNRTETYQDRLTNERIVEINEDLKDYESTLLLYRQAGVITEAEVIEGNEIVTEYKQLVTDGNIDAALIRIEEYKEFMNSKALANIQNVYNTRVSAVQPLLEKDTSHYHESEITEINALIAEINETISTQEGTLEGNVQLSTLTKRLVEMYAQADAHYEEETSRIAELEQSNRELRQVVNDLIQENNNLRP